MSYPLDAGAASAELWPGTTGVPLTSRVVRAHYFLVVVVFGLIAAACSGGSAIFPDDAVVVRANADLSMGQERILLVVVEPDGTRLSHPDAAVVIEVAPDGDPSRIQRQDATFISTIPDVAGFYGAIFDFDTPGSWQVTVVPTSGDPLETILVEVRGNECRAPGAAAPCAPRVGEMAPTVSTPTLGEAELEDLTTDSDPDPRFYGLSLDEALINGRPSVIIFSTPAYCRTATCGPILDNVKAVADEYPGVDFVHIEIYTGLREPGFVPDIAHLAPAVDEWTLPSEPWVFITNGSGVITARFEGAVGAGELREHL